MIKKITPEQVTVKETDKNGNPWKFDSVSVGIKVKGADGQEHWINGFCKKHNVPQQGVEVELKVWKDEKWGWKFKVPGKTDGLEARVEALEARIKALENNSAQPAPQPQIPQTNDSVVS